MLKKEESWSYGSGNLVFRQIPGALGVVKLSGCVEVGQHAHSPHQDWGQEKCDLKYEMISMWTKTKIVIFWRRDRWPTRTETQTEMGIRGSQSQPNSSPLSLVRGPSLTGLVDSATISSLVSSHPEPKTRKIRTCSGSIDAAEVCGVQGFRSWGKSLKSHHQPPVWILKYTSNFQTWLLQVQARPWGAQGAYGAVQAGSAQVYLMMGFFWNDIHKNI